MNGESLIHYVNTAQGSQQPGISGTMTIKMWVCCDAKWMGWGCKRGWEVDGNENGVGRGWEGNGKGMRRGRGLEGDGN